MAKVALLYERVVYIVTGSGIGPCRGNTLAARGAGEAGLVGARPKGHVRRRPRGRGRGRAARTPWSGTPRSRGSRTSRNWPARRSGDFDAEAVFVVSNKPTTLGLVRALEQLGIPAFGPIWDS